MPVTNPQKGLPQHPKIEIKSAPLPTLWQRLRQIKKKDLAFILAALSVLILAPVAQHYMLSPGEGDGGLEPGFSTREGGAGQGEVFEPGLGGFAPGSAPGLGESITPLSARDPSSLLMPPGGPPAPPKSSAADTIRDAVNRALRSGSEQAVEKAGLPQPSPRLASTLRGLAALAGAGGNNVAPLPIGGGSVLEGARSVPNTSAPRSYAGPIAPSDFRGAERSVASASTDAMESLRAQAEKAASHFGGPGPAASALEAAARDSIRPGGGTGIGGSTSGPSSDDKDKPHAGNNPPPGKWEIGESLHYKLAMMRAQKELDLMFKKREMVELMPYKMYEKFMEMGMEKIIGEGVMAPTGKAIGKGVKGLFESGPTKVWLCYKGASSKAIQVPEADVLSQDQDPTDGMWHIQVKSDGADGKPAQFELVCSDWLPLHDADKPKPTGKGKDDDVVVDPLTQMVGDTERNLEAVCADVAGKAKDACDALKKALKKTSEASTAVQYADLAHKRLVAAESKILLGAHEDALVPLSPHENAKDKGTAFNAMEAYVNDGASVVAAFQEAKVATEAYKTAHDGWTAKAPALKAVDQAIANLKASDEALEKSRTTDFEPKVRASLKGAEADLKTAAEERDKGRGLIDEVKKEGGATSKGQSGKATASGIVNQLESNFKNVKKGVEDAQKKHEEAKGRADDWEKEIYGEVRKLLQPVLGRATFGSDAQKAHAGTAALIDVAAYEKKADPKDAKQVQARAEANGAAVKVKGVSDGWTTLHGDAAKAHDKFADKNPVFDAFRQHASGK